MLQDIYCPSRRKKIEECIHLKTGWYQKESLLADEKICRELHVMISTWSMPTFSDEELKAFPNLEAVFYSAGTIKPFAEPFLKRGIKVISAWASNAIPVAEFTVAQIILASKGYWHASKAIKSRGKEHEHPRNSYPGMFEIEVALLGGGMIGSHVIKLLKNHHIKVLLVDPYFPQSKAEAMGVELVSLNQAFSRAQVVSNHLPNLPETEKMIGKEQFERMKDRAVFINTGRGQSVDEQGLIEVFSKRTDLEALLDVTFPEPPDEASPLYEMDNVHLTPHIAGAFGQERWRLVDTIIEELQSYIESKPLRYSISLEQLTNLA